jgi:vacuolar-type H+-ATPase subunit I/STV1
MSKSLSVEQMLAHLEARIASLRERRAFHAEQEAHHREQLALHDTELQTVLARFEAFKAAAEAAAEVVRASTSVQERPAEEAIPKFGNRPMVSRLVSRVVEGWPEGEELGAKAVAAEVNRRYGDVLKKPIRPGTASVVLRRLRKAGRIRQVRPGKALYEALYYVRG